MPLPLPASWRSLPSGVISYQGELRAGVHLGFPSETDHALDTLHALARVFNALPEEVRLIRRTPPFPTPTGDPQHCYLVIHTSPDDLRQLISILATAAAALRSLGVHCQLVHQPQAARALAESWSPMVPERWEVVEGGGWRLVCSPGEATVEPITGGRATGHETGSHPSGGPVR